MTTTTRAGPSTCTTRTIYITSGAGQTKALHASLQNNGRKVTVLKAQGTQGDAGVKLVAPAAPLLGRSALNVTAPQEKPAGQGVVDGVANSSGSPEDSTKSQPASSLMKPHVMLPAETKDHDFHSQKMMESHQQKRTQLNFANKKITLVPLSSTGEAHEKHAWVAGSSLLKPASVTKVSESVVTSSLSSGALNQREPTVVHRQPQPANFVKTTHPTIGPQSLMTPKKKVTLKLQEPPRPQIKSVLRAKIPPPSSLLSLSPQEMSPDFSGNFKVKQNVTQCKQELFKLSNQPAKPSLFLELLNSRFSTKKKSSVKRTASSSCDEVKPKPVSDKQTGLCNGHSGKYDSWEPEAPLCASAFQNGLQKVLDMTSFSTFLDQEDLPNNTPVAAADTGSEQKSAMSNLQKSQKIADEQLAKTADSIERMKEITGVRKAESQRNGGASGEFVNDVQREERETGSRRWDEASGTGSGSVGQFTATVMDDADIRDAGIRSSQANKKQPSTKEEKVQTKKPQVEENLENPKIGLKIRKARKTPVKSPTTKIVEQVLRHVISPQDDSERSLCETVDDPAENEENWLSSTEVESELEQCTKNVEEDAERIEIERDFEKCYREMLSYWERYLTCSPPTMRAFECSNARYHNYTPDALAMVSDPELSVWREVEALGAPPVLDLNARSTPSLAFGASPTSPST